MPDNRLPSPPADEAEARERYAALAERTRAAAFSTEPADRPRAERAIRALYREFGHAEPKVIWAPSPSAGALAYAAASGTRTQFRDPDAKGDRWTGYNRDLYALGNPLPLPDGMTERVARRIGARLADLGIGPELARVSAIAQAMELNESDLTLRIIRTSIQNRASTLVPTDFLHREPDARAATDLGRAVVGDAIDGLVATFGVDIVGEFVWEAVQRKFSREMQGERLNTQALQAMQPGQFDWETPTIASIEDALGAPIWRQLARRNSIRRIVDARLEIAGSAGPWWALDGFAIVSERPLRLLVDDRRRPHCEDGPALAYGDGTTIHAWHGVVVEPWVVEEPDRITVELIDSETNAEVRRVMIERFGDERLVREGGAELVHEDEAGRLWSRPLPGWRREEPIVMVEVVNSTPELDGSRKTYWLRVPPATQTAAEAVAWTFGLGEREYSPSVQT